MFKVFKLIQPIAPNSRNFKNFGHKREPVPTVTILWHGFLTFSFIACGIEWKRIYYYFTGEKEEQVSRYPWEARAKRVQMAEALEAEQSSESNK